MQSFIFALGSGLCHQLPERSFFFNGIQLPLCARCTGIYIGFVCAFTLLAIVYWRAPRRGGLSRFFYVSIALLGVPLVFDGLSSYLGFRGTTNTIRLLSGAAFGTLLAAPIYYIVCDALLKKASSQVILSDWKARLLWYFSVPITFVFVKVLGALSPLALTFFMGISIVLVFALTMCALVAMIPRFERSVDSVRSAIAPALISWCAGCVLLWGTWALQTAVHRLAGL